MTTHHAPGDDCAHAVTKRGKDIPRVYGSYRSEVCKACGSYRARDHRGNLVTGFNGGWRPASQYEADTTSSDE